MNFRNPFTNARVIGSNVDYEDYSRQDATRGEPDFIMSSGQLKDFARCPKKWRAGAETGDTDAKDYGSLLDCLVLRPDRFNSLFAVHPGHYFDDGMRCPKCESITPESKKCARCKVYREPIKIEKPWRFGATFTDAWKAKEEAAMRKVISPDDLSEAQSAVHELMSDPSICRIIECSEKQVMVVAEYKDPSTGIVVPVRILLDLVPDRGNMVWGRSLIDLKSSRSACPRFFAKQVFNMHYDLQGALYSDVYQAATGEGREDWGFIVQESEFPWITADPIPCLSAGQIEMGRQKYLYALQYYARCLASNTWPGYAPTRLVMGPVQILEEEAWMAAVLAESMSQSFDEQPEPNPEEALSGIH